MDGDDAHQILISNTKKKVYSRDCLEFVYKNKYVLLFYVAFTILLVAAAAAAADLYLFSLYNNK